MSIFNDAVVGNKALEVRKRCGWSQRDVAAWAGMKEPTLCYIESGTRTARLSDLVRLSKALRVTTDYLLGLK